VLRPIVWHGEFVFREEGGGPAVYGNVYKIERNEYTHVNSYIKRWGAGGSPWVAEENTKEANTMMSILKLSAGFENHQHFILLSVIILI
jgi:hypothetical protein